MSTVECTVHCDERVGSVPALSHAVMGNMSCNLLGTGVRLQRMLEEISDKPLLRRTMGTLCTGVGIDKGTGGRCTPQHGNGNGLVGLQSPDVRGMF